MDSRLAAAVGVLAMVAVQPTHPNVVTGTVSTPDGEPVAGAVVTLVERGQHLGQPVFHPVDARGHVNTDEHGAYRLENLPLGEFYVVAIPHNPTLTTDRRINRTGYRITYYPSAKTAAEAMPVSVNIHAPAVADIRLLAATLSVVSGTVIGENGQPVHGGKLNIAHGDNLFGMDSTAMGIHPDGAFMLPALPPGTYFLAYHESVWPPARGEIPLISDEKVVVDGRDIAGVRVAPIHMVSGSGHVVVADADRATFQPSQFEVAGLPADWNGNPGPQRGGRVRDDLTFEFKVWPRPHAVRVLIDQDGWRVKRVLRDGVDITDKPIDFKEGHDVGGIVIELARIGAGR
jgi:Carboxypeptidase regulatory-like domain